MSKNIQTIYRVIKNRDFTQVSNHILHNPKLSLKAKGLICLMLSLPDTWDFHRDHLVTLSSDGKDALKGGIKELQEAGHVTIGNERDEKGRIKKWVMEVRETPATIVAQHSYPEVENPQVDKPQVDNPPFSNTKALSNTNSNSNTKDAVVEKIKSEISDLKIEESKIKMWLAGRDADYILDKIKKMRESNRKNPEGWLISAIERDFQGSPLTVSPSIKPASHEVWTPELQTKRDRDAEKLLNPNDWREQMIQERIQSQAVGV